MLELIGKTLSQAREMLGSAYEVVFLQNDSPKLKSYDVELVVRAQKIENKILLTTSRFMTKAVK